MERAHIEYDLVTPYKLLISGAYVFQEVQDVRLQKGFISEISNLLIIAAHGFTRMEKTRIKVLLITTIR